jgi:RNA polymerase sigma factor (TIGR02999 family)
MALSQNDGAAGGPSLGQEGREALDLVFSLVYEDLRRLASWYRRREPHMTVSTGTLVHEAWIKLKDSPQLAATSEAHFKGIAARAMRQILVDEARRRKASKRDAPRVSLDSSADSAVFTEASIPPALATAAEVLDLDSALNRLEKMNARQARMVECRFFGGLNVTETAEALGVSESAIERDWHAAKAWLASTLRPGYAN